MLIEHLDAQLLTRSIEYERFVSDCDKLDENPPSDPEELVREEDRLFVEGHRLQRELMRYTAQTPEGAAAQKRIIDHCNRGAGTTSAKRAQQAGSLADALAWHLIAALPVLLPQLDTSTYAKGEVATGAV